MPEDEFTPQQLETADIFSDLVQVRFTEDEATLFILADPEQLEQYATMAERLWTMGYRRPSR